jgi:hypothetical protein
MTFDATLIKHYPRQHHTRITVMGPEGQREEYNGRTTEMLLYGAASGVFLVINTYADAEATEPKTHEVVLFAPRILVEAREEVIPEPVEGTGDAAHATEGSDGMGRGTTH